MKDSQKISYSYTRDFKNPIRFNIQTKTVTTTMDYNDALEIAYAVIDSLYGSYEYLDDLTDKFENEQNKGIKFEEV